MDPPAVISLHLLGSKIGTVHEMVHVIVCAMVLEMALEMDQ
jgi:hypothetical protein